MLLAHIHPVAIHCPDVLAASNADFSCLERVYAAVHMQDFGVRIVLTSYRKTGGKPDRGKGIRGASDEEMRFIL